MKDRLIQFLHSEQISPARFADILGVQRSGISHLLSGRNKPGFDFIEKMLVKFPDLNAEWLITGKGKTYKGADAPTLLPENEVKHPEVLYNPPREETNVREVQHHHLLSGISTLKQDGRSISKIIIFYTDRSFGEYHPE